MFPALTSAASPGGFLLSQRSPPVCRTPGPGNPGGAKDHDEHQESGFSAQTPQHIGLAGGLRWSRANQSVFVRTGPHGATAPLHQAGVLREEFRSGTDGEMFVHLAPGKLALCRAKLCNAKGDLSAGGGGITLGFHGRQQEVRAGNTGNPTPQDGHSTSCPTTREPVSQSSATGISRSCY